MTITGEMRIGWQSIRSADITLHALNPTTGMTLEPAFGDGSAFEVHPACQLAQSAFRPFRELLLGRRAAFLEPIAEGLIGLDDEPVEKIGTSAAHSERSSVIAMAPTVVVCAGATGSTGALAASTSFCSSKHRTLKKRPR